MSKRSSWLDGLPEVRRVLKEAHQGRHRAGRDATKLRNAEIERLRDAGDEARAGRLEEAASKKSIQFMRLKRQAEEREAERELKKLGAALRREERKAFKRQPPEKLFIQFEAQARAKDGRLRDLYYDWIGRGLGSGKKRDYARAQKRSSSRTTPWKSGEMGRKIRYIFRNDALEEVEGNTLQNMGDDIVEAVACSRLLEELERIGRSKNGGVYHHVILALPHQLSGKQRAELLEELTRPLREMKLPFCAALHKPDKRGDERNYHAHIVLSLRLMDRVGEYQWEFGPSKRTWLNTTAGLRLQRKFVARSFNRALSRAGIEARWTHKSREDRGEQSPGNTKKGPERTREERAIQQAAQEYRDARKLIVDIVADEQALMRLEQVEEILERTAGPVNALIERTLNEAEQARADTAAEAQPSKSTPPATAEREIARQLPAEQEVRPLEQPKETEAAPVAQMDPALLDAQHRREEMRRNHERRMALIQAHTAGMSQMFAGVGKEPSEEWLDRVRDEILAGRVCAVRDNDRTVALLARDKKLLVELVRSFETPKMIAYMREVARALPPPPEDLTDWAIANLVRKRDAAGADDRRGLGVDPGLPHGSIDDLEVQRKFREDRGLGKN